MQLLHHAVVGMWPDAAAATVEVGCLLSATPAVTAELSMRTAAVVFAVKLMPPVLHAAPAAVQQSLPDVQHPSAVEPPHEPGQALPMWPYAVQQPTMMQYNILMHASMLVWGTVDIGKCHNIVPTCESEWAYIVLP